VIRSFRHKGLEDFFFDGTKKGIQPHHARRLEEVLDRLHGALEIGDMRFPGSGLHLLEPRTQGRWALKISGNWRLTFRFEAGDALEVDYVDYH
jgi:toxin HigB-1